MSLSGLLPRNTASTPTRVLLPPTIWRDEKYMGLPPSLSKSLTSPPSPASPLPTPLFSVFDACSSVSSLLGSVVVSLPAPPPAPRRRSAVGSPL
eukprot:scaffold247346_cov28-Tisochrysis_lutea.AAC.2